MKALPLLSRLPLALSLMISTSLLAVADTSGVPEWIQQEKIRLGWSPASFEQYPLMKSSGMNAVMPRIELVAEANYQPEGFERIINKEDELALDKLRKSSSLAKELGLRYFHCLGIACTSSTVHAGYKDNAARFNDDVLPSPVDVIYWKRTILDRVDRALRILKDDSQYALDAIIIDPEMYALGDGIPGEPDYGTYAFGRFLADHPEVKAPELSTPTERKEWLTSRQLGSDYIKWQHQEIVKLGRELRALIDSHRPGLIVGFIIYENRLWFNAIAEGMSTGGLPVFVGPESTYSGVMDNETISLFASMRKNLKVPVLLVPGVSIGSVNGSVPVSRLQVLPGNIYQRCLYSEGYWVYAIYSFGVTEQEQRPYFGVLNTVNDALDRQALTGKVDEALVAAPFPVEVPGHFPESLAFGKTLQPVSTEVPRPQLPVQEPKLRGSYTFLLWPKEGSRNHITTRSIQLNPNYLDPVSTTIFDKEGKELYVAPTALGKTRIIWLPDLANQFCIQISSAGQNSFGVSDSTAPVMIHAPEGITTNSQGGEAGTFYFHVPAEAESFSLELYGRPKERVEYTLHSPDGKEDRHWKTLQKVTRETISTQGREGIWAVSMRNATNNAHFKLISLPNLFALRAEDLRK